MSGTVDEPQGNHAAKTGEEEVGSGLAVLAERNQRKSVIRRSSLATAGADDAGAALPGQVDDPGDDDQLGDMSASPGKRASNASNSKKSRSLSVAPLPLSKSHPPPTGEVALVFTDVQSSTQLWSLYPEPMKVALRLHNRLLREELHVHKGYEVKTEGDAFMITFPTARDGINFCLSTQEKLLMLDWPEELMESDEVRAEKDADGELLFRGLRVRMGLHFAPVDSEPDPTHGREDYFGPMVNLTARIASTALGGQVLVSNAVGELLNENGGPKDANGRQTFAVVDMGSFKLKGIPEPERLFQVMPVRLGGRFSALDTMPATMKMWGTGGSQTQSSYQSKSNSSKAGSARDKALDMNLKLDDGGKLSAPWLKRAGDFKLKQRIGQGQSGELYAAMWNGMEVAVKRYFRRDFSDEMISAMMVELSFLSELRHPNIVQFLAAVVEPTRCWVVTELFPNGSLSEVLADANIDVPWGRKVKWLTEVSNAMCYLHNYEPPIIHRDLKCENLLVTADFSVKVGDFGFARVADDDAQMTQCGTMAWCAPEILKGEKYSLAADVYSFGLVMFEIGSRQRPYVSQAGDRALPMLIINGKRPDIPDTFPQFWGELMAQCWQSDQTARPSFQVIAETILENVDASQDSASAPPSKSLGNSIRGRPMVSLADDQVKISVQKGNAKSAAAAARGTGISVRKAKSSTCVLL